MQIINSNCSDGIATNVGAFTSKNMNYIASDKGNYVEFLKGEFGDSLFIFKFFYDEIWTGMYTNFSLYPAMNYSTSYAYNSSAFQPDTYDYYGDNPISYDTSCYWTQNGSVDGPLGDFFTYSSQQMDRFYGYFKTPFFSDGVQRVNMVFLQNLTNTTATKILRVWPCQKVLNNSLMLDDIMEEGVWKYTSYSYNIMLEEDPGVPDYPYIILSGPSRDKVNNRYPTCSFSNWLVINGTFCGYFQLEVRNSYFTDIFKNLTFLNTGITVFFSLFGNVISPPGIWFEVDPMNLTVTLWDIYWRTDMTITYYYDELFNRSVNSDQLREIKILNQYYQETDYYESTVLLPYNFIETTYKRWEFGLILYVQKAEIDSIQQGTSNAIRNHTSLILVVGLLCCSFTGAIIIVFCFFVAMSISKPLKNVIRVANFINDNAGKKEVISQIINDVGGLPEGEFQMKVLVRAFKKFIGVVDGGSQKKNQTRTIVKPCFYPLNQFNRDYLSKAKKGISPINWYEYIERIETLVDQESECEFFEE